MRAAKGVAGIIGKIVDRRRQWRGREVGEGGGWWVSGGAWL